LKRCAPKQGAQVSFLHALEENPLAPGFSPVTSTGWSGNRFNGFDLITRAQQAQAVETAEPSPS